MLIVSMHSDDMSIKSMRGAGMRSTSMRSVSAGWLASTSMRSVSAGWLALATLNEFSPWLESCQDLGTRQKLRQGSDISIYWDQMADIPYSLQTHCSKNLQKK